VTADEALIAVLDGLDSVGVPYMIVGSLASNFHGIPRSTRDADLVVDLGPGQLERLAGVLPPALKLNQQSAFETVTGTTRYLVELAGSPFVCELFLCSDDAHDRERFSRRLRVRLAERTAWVSSAEDAIVTKLRWAGHVNRAKDRDDIRNILAVRGLDLDWHYLRRWSDIHGTTPLLDEIRASLQGFA